MYICSVLPYCGENSRKKLHDFVQNWRLVWLGENTLQSEDFQIAKIKNFKHCKIFPLHSTCIMPYPSEEGYREHGASLSLTTGCGSCPSPLHWGSCSTVWSPVSGHAWRGRCRTGDSTGRPLWTSDTRQTGTARTGPREDKPVSCDHSNYVSTCTVINKMTLFLHFSKLDSQLMLYSNALEVTIFHHMQTELTGMVPYVIQGGRVHKRGQ